MRCLSPGVFLIAASTCKSGALPSMSPAESTIAIRGVTVVDATGAPPRADQTVVISGNRIVAAASAANVRVPRQARVVDGSGKYLIPGLWDMHTHVTGLGKAGLELSVANGVTGVRDMGAIRFATTKAWRDSIAAGLLLGPRMKIASPVVERPNWLAAVRKFLAEAGASTETLKERFGPNTVDEMVRWVDSVKAIGTDHIKVRNWPNAEISKALVARARERGLPVVAHPNQPFPVEGVASYEHYIFPPLQVSDAKRDSMFRQWGASGVAIVPTLVTWPGRLHPVDTLKAMIDPARTPMYRYIPPAIREDWLKELDARKNESPYDYHALYRVTIRDLKEMKAAGMPVLAGTDGLGFPPVPGFSLHDELVQLVSLAGLTTVEALQAATLRPAEFLGLADSLGSIGIGKVADLVLLDADPLTDIRNTRRIRAVVINGRLLERTALDRLLAAAEAAAH